MFADKTRSALLSRSKQQAIGTFMSRESNISIGQSRRGNGNLVITQDAFGTAIVKGPGYENPIPLGPHILVPNGPNYESDGTEAVYWVKPIYCATNDDSSTAPFVQGVPLTGSDIVPATCIEELFTTNSEDPPYDPIYPYQHLLDPTPVPFPTQVEVYGIYDNTVVDGTMDLRLRRYFHWPFTPVIAVEAVADAVPIKTGVPTPTVPTGWWSLECRTLTANPKTITVPLPGGVRQFSGEWDHDETPAFKLTTQFAVIPAPVDASYMFEPLSLPYGLDPSPIGTIKGWNFDPTNDGETIGQPQMPLGWSAIELDGSGGRFLVSLSPTPPYDTLGKTGGFAWHGETENNHPDHASHHHTVDISQDLTAALAIEADLVVDTDDATSDVSVDGQVITGTITGASEGEFETDSAYTGIPSTTNDATSGISDIGHDHGLSPFNSVNITNADMGGDLNTIDVGYATPPFLTDMGYSDLSEGTGHNHGITDEGHVHTIDIGTLATDLTWTDDDAGAGGHIHSVAEPNAGAGHHHGLTLKQADINGIPVNVDAVDITDAETSDQVVGEGLSAVKHKGPFNDSKDTDNAPPYQIIGAWIVRTA